MYLTLDLEVYSIARVVIGTMLSGADPVPEVN